MTMADITSLTGKGSVPETRDYARQVLGHDSMRRWMAAARVETDRFERYEAVA